jgi:heptosyltransferase-2
MSTVNRILIIRFSSLGDILLVSPLIRLLHQKYPAAKIDFVVFREYSDLIRHHPALNKIFEFDKSEGFRGLNRIAGILRDQKYDVILDVHHNFRSSWLTLKAGTFSSGSRVYRIKKQKIARFLLVKFKINLYQRLYGRVIPVWEKYIRVARHLGITPGKNEARLEFYLPESVVQSCENILKEKNVTLPYVTMAPGARHFTKRWPAEKYAEVINYLHRTRGLRTVLVGGPTDNITTQEVLEKTERRNTVSLAGQISLTETAEIIRRSQLLITNDSGLMHVGSAMGLPLIAIFGSTVQEFGFFPVNSNSFVLQNQGLYCRPCSHIGRNACPEKHFKCMTEIETAAVIKLTEDILERQKKD